MSAVIEFEHDVERLPASWTKTTLGAALARSEGGGTPPRDVEEYWNGNIPWASVKDVVKGGGVAPEETISDAGLKNSTSKLIPAGTNIFAARMGVGAVARYPFPVAINQDLIALTPSSALDPEFLFFWLQARKEDFVSVATGTTVKGIRKDVLLSFPLFLPPPSMSSGGSPRCCGRWMRRLRLPRPRLNNRATCLKQLDFKWLVWMGAGQTGS